jgi:hypothetical protein
VEAGTASAILIDPINGRPMIPSVTIKCLSRSEAMDPKVRVALCGTEVAIRDYFDVDHSVISGKLDLTDYAFLDLVRRKVATPPMDVVEVSDVRVEDLRRQNESQLKPVLREREFVQFDLERAVGTVRELVVELTRR